MLKQRENPQDAYYRNRMISERIFTMNRLMTFDKYRVFETEFASRPLKVETGKMTQLANGACLVHYGDTTVHVAVTADRKSVV